MSDKLENAKKLYLEGIRDGRVRETVTKYTGKQYIQHSTGVADGVEGFVAFFDPFVQRCKVRDIEIKRGWEDGEYVFVQAYQNINNGEAQWVTADMFHTDDHDKIIEHWDVIQAYEKNEAPGRTMVDGPSEITDLDKTEVNKQLIRDFYDKVLIGGDFDVVTSYISSEQFDQHSPGRADGVDSFTSYMEGNGKSEVDLSYENLHRMVGQGNFVAALSQTKYQGEEHCFIDIYRIADGLIVEHWDVKEKILPQEQWGNVGKF